MTIMLQDSEGALVAPTSGQLAELRTALGAVDQTAGDSRYVQIGAADAGPANDMGAGLVIDVTKLVNKKSSAANLTLTFSATPAADTFFGLEITNSDSAPITVTIPSSYSSQQQEAITSFSLPAGAVAFLLWKRSGAINMLAGEPVPLARKAMQWTFGTGANDTQTLLLETAEAGRVDRIVVKSDSGTATYQLQIAGVSVGPAMSVASTKAAQDLASPVAFAAGALVTLVRTSNSSCANGSIQVIYRPNQA